MKEPKNDLGLHCATPADISSWQSRKRAIVLDTVDEQEVRDVLVAVLEKAKKGDLQAARLILAYAVGSPPSREPNDPGPTAAPAGSKAKLDVLAHRYAKGLPLHKNGDGGKVDLS
jgi:hypothetical protein